MTTQYDNDVETERSRVAAAKDKARERAAAAREKAGAALEGARERTHAAYDTARDRANEAYGSARQSVSQASRKTAEEIKANPFGALVGGLAVGALIAALLPKTKGEEELLGKVGRRINSGAKDAAKAAREAGTDKLAEFGFTRETAKQKINALADNAGVAARTSAEAAAKTLKSRSKV